jgi:hypothetical protein
VIVRTTLLLLLVLAGAARAEYMEPQLQEVPIERLIANVERRVKAAPDDPGGQLELGRLHAMAFSLGAVAQVRSGTLHVYFGPEPRRLPWADEVTPPGKAPQDAAARAHLVEAIRLHREAVRLRPEDLVARLGLGWLLSRSTDAKEAAEAVAHLRQAATAAWEEEEDVESYGKGPSPAREAATYLLQLLDPAKDQAEVADLKRRIATIEGRPRAVTPIALPLDDGCDLAAARAPDARVAFDLDGAGRRGGWSWITPRAGWLVWLPRDGSRRVDSGLQLFGGCTWWVFWSDGYAPLAALDDDGDGALRGRELANLGVWRDEDSDGQSDPGEVRPLAAWGIVALDVRGEAGDGRTTAAWAPRGATLADGRTRPTWDLLLRFSPSGR